MLLLHILLFLLKLIGIVVLVILGLIVLILAIVLFTPVKYQVGVMKNQALLAEGKVTWLFHLVELFVRLDTEAEEGKRFHLSFRIAWHSIYDNQKPKKRRIKSKKIRKTTPKMSQAQSETEHIEDTPVLENKRQLEEPAEPEESVKPEEPRIEAPEETITEKIAHFVRRIKTAVWRTIQIVVKMIASVLRIPSKVMEGIEKLEAVLTKLRDKKKAFLGFYYEEQNHRWFVAFWQRLRKLFFRILPKTDKLYLHFGFDDPATTGQVLGGLSVLYPICGEKMELCPDFATTILEGEVKCHGQIRLIILVVFAVKSFLNKQFFAIVKQLKSLLKGE